MLQIYYNSFDICKRKVKKVLVPLQPLYSKGYSEGHFKRIFQGRKWARGKALFKGVFKDTMRVCARARGMGAGGLRIAGATYGQRYSPRLH